MNQHVLWAAGWCVCGGLVSGIWAGTETNHAAAPLAMPEVTVTASRMERDVMVEPATAYRLPGQATEVSRASRTTPEALYGVPSVMVQKTSYGQGSPFLRGFTGFRTLALVDGIRLNNSAFRDGPNQYWNTIDPLSVANYDLVMGPGSVLYGSDAIGGTLNALTVEPPEYTGSPVWDRRIFYRGSTAEDSNSGRVQLGGRWSEAAGFVGGITARSFGDLQGGQDVGEQAHTGYDELDFDGRFDYRPNADGHLTVAHQTVDQDDAWRTHRTIYGIEWEGLTHGDDKVHSFDQHRDLTYLRYRQEELDALADNAELTVSRHAQAEDQVRVRKDDTGDEQGFDVATWGATLQLESLQGAWGDWVYGADYYHDNVDSYARRLKADGQVSRTEIQGPIADDATYDLAGIFAEDTLHLGDGALDLTPGMRYTFAAADADKVKDPVGGNATTLSDEWSAWVNSLRALAPLTEDRRQAVFGSVSQGFRAPNLSDLTRLDSARSNEIETPSPDLDPEAFVAFEVGLKSQLSRLHSQCSYYYTLIDDMIVRTPTGHMVDDLVEVTKKNSGDGYVQGIELTETYWVTDDVSLWVAGSWMEGRVDAYPTSAAEQQRDYLSRLMPLSAEIGTRWQHASGRYWVEGRINLADDADKLSADDRRDTQRIPPGGTPGYAVGHVSGGTMVTEALRLTLAVENILDEDYRIHGSGVNEPGRNVILTADCRF